jgi:UDP-glucose 4-epimerase
VKALVTGGFGYLGSHIAEDLVKAGHEVTVLGIRDHPERGAWRDQFRVIVADVADEAAMADVCEGMDAVIHTAALNAQASEDDGLAALMVTGWGTRNVLQSTGRHDIKLFIYLSTFHVYGPPEARLVTEDTPTFPATNYALAHQLAEDFCFQARRTGTPAIVLRLSNGYGAPLFADCDCWTLVLNDFCKTAVEDGEIVLRSTGEQKRDFVAIPDILQAIGIFTDRPQLAVPSTGYSVYHVGGGRSIAIRELAEVAARAASDELGRQIGVRFEIDPNRVEKPVDFDYSIQRIRSIGYEPQADLATEARKIVRFLLEEA